MASCASLRGRRACSRRGEARRAGWLPAPSGRSGTGPGQPQRASNASGCGGVPRGTGLRGGMADRGRRERTSACHSRPKGGGRRMRLSKGSGTGRSRLEEDGRRSQPAGGGCRENRPLLSKTRRFGNLGTRFCVRKTGCTDEIPGRRRSPSPLHVGAIAKPPRFWHDGADGVTVRLAAAPCGTDIMLDLERAPCCMVGETFGKECIDVRTG